MAGTGSAASFCGSVPITYLGRLGRCWASTAFPPVPSAIARCGSHEATPETLGRSRLSPTSHVATIPSFEAVKIVRLSGPKTARTTSEAWGSTISSWRNLSQRNALSPLVVRTKFPSGEMRTPVTVPGWRPETPKAMPESVLHLRARRSLPPVTIPLPSGKNAAALTPPSCRSVSPMAAPLPALRNCGLNPSSGSSDNSRSGLYFGKGSSSQRNAYSRVPAVIGARGDSGSPVVAPKLCTSPS